MTTFFARGRWQEPGEPVRCGAYPYMNCAADIGADYGDVLCYADYLAPLSPDNHWQHIAKDRLTEDQQRAVQQVCLAEQMRRAKISKSGAHDREA